MAERLTVHDAADPRLDDFRDLTVADRRPDRPGGRGAVIAEGVVVVRRLLASPYPVRALLGVAARIDDLGEDLSTVDVPAYVVTPEVMSAVVGFHLNRGVLAVAERGSPPSLDELLTGRLLLILEGVNDHENLGALFRNAAALGVDAVLLGLRCSDPLYRRSVRVSMGHVLRMPFATLPRWPADLNMIRAAGYDILALTPRAGAVPLRRVDPAAHPRLALLVGAEGPGLSEAALSAADVQVRIPMAGDVDSLNVATAAAIACYHLGRT
ncbi:MAG: TrmH family RNA methyltransferase [Geodermatophilaceae bacterium]